jgi:hypothetical protein
MSTDYNIVCFDCKKRGPIFASGSVAYGYKVWVTNDELLKWLGHREDIGLHEGHDLRIVDENIDLDWPDKGTD